MHNNKKLKIYWKRAPSQPVDMQGLRINTSEELLLKTINLIGIISGGQIARYMLLHTNQRKTRHILKGMVAKRMLIEHILDEKGATTSKQYKLYSLGEAGAKLIAVSYEPDYWYSYKKDEVLDRLLALDFYIKLKEKIADSVAVRVAAKPYLFTFTAKEQDILVGVARETDVAFVEHFRWDAPSQKTVILCNSLQAANGLLRRLEPDMPVRVVTKQSMRDKLVVYRASYDNYKWEKEE